MIILYGRRRRALYSLLMVAGMLIVSGLLVVSCSVGSSGTSSSGGNNLPGDGGNNLPGDGDNGSTDCALTDDGEDCDGDLVENALDDFPSNPCASVDSDGDGVADAAHGAEVTACEQPNDVVIDNCPAVANADQANNEQEANRDAVGDACDVDDDNDGLIEIYNANMLWAMHCDPTGRSYKAAMTETDGSVMLNSDGYPVCGEDETGSTNGAATNATIDCTSETEDMSGIYLCGHELGENIVLPDNWRALPSFDISINSNDIFEGNGHKLTLTPGTERIMANTPAGGLFDGTGGAGRIIIRNLRVSGTLKVTQDTTSPVGGIAGNLLLGDLVAVSSAVTVDSQDNNNTEYHVGGIVGAAHALHIYSSFAAGAVIESSTGAIMPMESVVDVGGLVGIASNSAFAMTNSYAAGTVTGTTRDMRRDNIGGLIGNNTIASTITNSYSSASVKGHGDVADAVPDNVGGLIGLGPIIGDPATSYYDMANVTASADGDMENIVGTPVSAEQLTGCDQSVAPLTGSSASDCNTLYVGWETKFWDFGDSTELPALKYADISAVNGQECTPVPMDGDLGGLPFRPNNISQPYCGKFLPDQGGRQIGAGPQ